MKKARLLIFAAFLLVGAAIIALGMYIQDSESLPTIRFVCSAADDVEERIALYQDNEKYYAFLPSYADLKSTRIEYRAGCSLYLDGKYYNSDTDCSDLSTDKTYSMVIKNAVGMTVGSEKLVVKKAENIGTLAIHLTNGSLDEINADQSVSKKGYCSLIKANKKLDYSGRIDSLQGRGNTTWAQDKKPYTMQLSEEADLLGMGSSKTWVLLSNSFDESGLRNKLAYDAAKELGVKYAVNSEYVDLYVDNSYYGLFLLAEKVEVGENRVNITDLESKTKEINDAPLKTYPEYFDVLGDKTIRGFNIENNPDDITGGYLAQIEHHKHRIMERESIFHTDDLSFSLSSPKYASKEQISYISKQFKKCESKLKKDDLSMIDAESFVNYYFIQEFFANTDNCSFYICKDTDRKNGKLCACSIWDFDLSMGNSWRVSTVNPKTLYRCYDNWYEYLYRNEEFKQLVVEKYKEYKKSVQSSLFDRINEYGKKIARSFDMDKIRWRCSTNQDTRADESQKRFDTIDGHIERITDFMTKRISFLDSLWIKGNRYFRVGFASTEKIYPYKYRYSVLIRHRLHDYPNPECDDTIGYRFLGWYDENGNKFEEHMIIRHSAAYTARWEKIESPTVKPKTAVTTQTSKSFFERIAWRFKGKHKYFTIGFGIIGLSVVIFIFCDIRRHRKSRRYKNGLKH